MEETKKEAKRTITFTPEQWDFFSKMKSKDLKVFASFSGEQLQIISRALQNKSHNATPHV